MKQALTAERRNQLSQMIVANGSIQISDVAKHFGVTTETIRKDLIYLDKMGIVKKSYGGAISTGELMERPFSKRAMEMMDEKNRIASRAIEFLPQKAIVILDSGSTVICLAKLITLRKGLTIITNSISAANILADSDNSLYLVGGEVRSVTMSLAGYWATNAFRSIKADVAFLGSSGFMSHGGPCAESFIEAEVKRTIINSSKTKVVLADSSKFMTDALVEYSDWNDVSYLVTDTGASHESVDKINKRVQVILA
jgi:DeoR/GlpR family transcriptional regulator of sugar metabolism